MESFSLLTPLGYQVNSCGYCKSERRSPSYYCHGYRSMHPADYEALANRMFRRSGTTYYRPDTRNACCPQYTIRLDSYGFQVSRQQKKLSNKFTSYVIGHEYKRRAAEVFPKSRESKKSRKGVFDICERIRDPEWDKLSKRESQDGSSSVMPAHRFEVTLEPDNFTEEKYQLFEQYQRNVHKEPEWKISRKSFQSFLCCGMSRTMYAADDRQRPLGSYHQCYRLDGKLVAIGVLDLLPHAVSSVYLIYHTDFSHLEFGKLSALREIAMAKEMGYQYYYMGFYIHSCAKMRYKRAFKPTYVLDPESYEWLLFDKELLARFDAGEHISLVNSSSKSSNAPPPQGTSLFKTMTPGIPSPADIRSLVDLSDILLYYDSKTVCLPNLVWNDNEMCNAHSIIGRLAEFVACVGIENLALVSRSEGALHGSSEGKGGVMACLDWLEEPEEEEKQTEEADEADETDNTGETHQEKNDEEHTEEADE